MSSQNTGINTTSPKAALEVTASNVVAPLSTDGLLMPRINTFPAINPAADQNGMLVFLTTVDGSNSPGIYYWDHSNTLWVGFKPAPTITHYVGELFGGGIVYYVYDNGDHGLIASLDDLDGGAGIAWSGETNIEIGLNAKHFDGATNTAAIIAQDATPNKAATLCDAYAGGGFTDWYLPSLDEFLILRQHTLLLDKVLNYDGNPATNGLVVDHSLYNGSISDDSYWTSTEYDHYRASVGILMGTHSIWRVDKSGDGIQRVRAIRSF